MRDAQYSDKVYEFGTISQSCEIFKLSRRKLMQLATMYGCVVPIGTRHKRINIKKLVACLEKAGEQLQE